MPKKTQKLFTPQEKVAILRVARYFAEHADLDPTVTWED
jgi:hypothetical protein